MEQPEIEEHQVEEFLDKTVEWLSANSEKPMLIDFEEVTWVCSDFAAHLTEYHHDATAKGFVVDFVNVAPSVRPYVDVEAITERLQPTRSVLSISTKQVLEDIQRNLSNQDLMSKYGLSLRGLASVFKKLLNKGLITRQYLEERNTPENGPIEIELDGDDDFMKTKVSARDVLRDIADDMPDEMLMQKYGLSEKGLHSMWMKLLLGNLISA